MGRSRQKAKKRKEAHSFVQFPHYMLTDASFGGLSARACKLLLYLAGQYKGSNNGDLQATIKLARAAGWNSMSNLQAATRELEEAGFIVRTRQGGRNRCSLFALTWFPVDYCNGKLDIPASNVASNDWRSGRNRAPLVGQLDPLVDQSSAA